MRSTRRSARSRLYPTFVRAEFILLLVVLCGLVFTQPVSAASVTLTDYRQAIQTSLADLSNAQQSPIAVADDLRGLTDVTLADGSIVSPDLTLVIADLDATPVRLTDAERQLSALLGQIDQALASGSSATADSAASASLRQVLARSEFRPKSSRESRSFFGWLFAKVGRVFRPVSRPIGRFIAAATRWVSRAGSLWSVVAIVVGLTALVALLIWAIRGLRHVFGPAVARFPMAINGERPSAVNLRAEAESMAQRRSYRLAIRALYLAALLRLDELGALSFERALTNREVLRAARTGGSAQLFDQLAPLVERFDRHWYGAVSCTEDDYQEFRQLSSWAWEVA
ncbi:MAG TPA: DUF4129 domain-containing protein [Nitrolancea sp.]|nr:DUF4129 domain-containing protein [Nitrolancea sp.]